MIRWSESVVWQTKSGIGKKYREARCLVTLQCIWPNANSALATKLVLPKRHVTGIHNLLGFRLGKMYDYDCAAFCVQHCGVTSFLHFSFACVVRAFRWQIAVSGTINPLRIYISCGPTRVTANVITTMRLGLVYIWAARISFRRLSRFCRLLSCAADNAIARRYVPSGRTICLAERAASCSFSHAKPAAAPRPLTTGRR